MIFLVPGDPTGKGRPKFSTSRGYVHAYTPEKTQKYELSVKSSYLLAGGRKMEGPIRISVTAYFRIPKGTSKVKRWLMVQGGLLPAKRPDADNILKVILDGLNRVAYEDDAQVTAIDIKKRYTDGSPYVRVEVTTDEG